MHECKDNEYVQEQLYSWLEMHKKSALTQLVLQSLESKARWSGEIAEWLAALTEWDISEKSLYRTLRRMVKNELITFTLTEAERTGASRKTYELTSDGKLLLSGMKQELSYLRNLM